MWNLDNENKFPCEYTSARLTIHCSVTIRKYYQSYKTKQKILSISAKLSLRDVFLHTSSYLFQKNS